VASWSSSTERNRDQKKKSTRGSRLLLTESNRLGEGAKRDFCSKTSKTRDRRESSRKAVKSKKPWTQERKG